MTGHLLNDRYTVNPPSSGAKTKPWIPSLGRQPTSGPVGCLPAANVRGPAVELSLKNVPGAKGFAVARLMTARDRVRANGQSAAAAPPSDESAQNHQETWNTRACDWSGNSSNSHRKLNALIGIA